MRVPDDYAESAGLLAEIGRVGDAILWCEEGLTVHADRTWQLAPLRELLALLHRDRGDTGAALQVFWIAVEERTDALASLQGSLAGAERTGSQVHVQHLSATIIEVLLFEGSVDDAWRAATERDCDQRLWMQLARARESEHPEDAIPIYEREVETLIGTKNDGGYRDAVKLMVHIESMYVRLGRRDAFSSFVERIRAAHVRKANLMRRVGAKGW